MYMDMSKAVEVVELAAPDNTENIDASLVEELVSGSLIGSELFACEAAGLEISQWREDIERRLFELMQCDFDLDECDAFKNIMKHANACKTNRQYLPTLWIHIVCFQN